MKYTKFMKATLVAFFVFSQAHAEDKWLQWNVNKVTWVRIANIPCPIKEIASKYPLGAVAYNSSRKEYLFGCFAKKDEETIEIQWAGGDRTAVPANLFLVQQ